MADQKALKLNDLLFNDPIKYRDTKLAQDPNYKFSYDEQNAINMAQMKEKAKNLLSSMFGGGPAEQPQAKPSPQPAEQPQAQGTLGQTIGYPGYKKQP